MENNTQSGKKWFVVIGADRMFRHLPFVYFMAALALLYIANAHMADRNLRKIQYLKNEVQESRWRYISAKSDLMYNTTQSQMEQRVRKINLISNGVAPIMIEKR